MGAKACLLPGAVALVVVIIEAGLADADHARVRGRVDQAGGVGVGVVVCLVRVDADRRPDVGLAVGERDDGVPLRDAGADTKHRPDPGSAGAGDDPGLILDQPGIVQVTVRIDKHQAGSTQRGNTPCGAGSGVPAATTV